MRPSDGGFLTEVLCQPGLRDLLTADAAGRLKTTSVGLKVFERQTASVRNPSLSI